VPTISGRHAVTHRYSIGSMQTHRWWLAVVATLLTPWIGPHIDQYVPVGWVLFRARAEDVDHAVERWSIKD